MTFRRKTQGERAAVHGRTTTLSSCLRSVHLSCVANCNHEEARDVLMALHGVTGSFHFTGFHISQDFRSAWSCLQVYNDYQDIGLHPAWPTARSRKARCESQSQ